MSEDKLLDLIDKVSKAVVNVNTLQILRDVFNRRLPLRGMGSGFIVDSDGLVVTNYHVVEKANKIGVALHDGTIIEGRQRSYCSGIDVATIKIEADNLSVVELGDSDKLRVGQTVYALGNPFGLEGGPTVTSGVISALNREIGDSGVVLHNLVQTDAAINPGNSGGPLIDLNGRVVAINTAIIPYAQGIGFAVPINAVKECIEKTRESGGEYYRPWIGIQGIALTRRIADYYNLAVDRGVLVSSVVDDGPAFSAGIESGDVIVSVDDDPVTGIEELRTILDHKKVGESIKVMVVRDSGRGYVDVIVSKGT
jgi:serine protease Do